MKKDWLVYGLAVALPFLAGRLSTGKADVETATATAPRKGSQPDGETLAPKSASNFIASQRLPVQHRVELEEISTEELDGLFQQAIDACLSDLSPLTAFEAEHREVVQESENGSALISKIPKIPTEIYDSILGNGVAVFRSRADFSTTALRKIVDRLETELEIHEADHYIVARADIDGGHYSLYGYFADAPLRFTFEKPEGKPERIVTRGARPVASYRRLSTDALFEKRFNHLFLVDEGS